MLPLPVINLFHSRLSSLLAFMNSNVAWSYPVFISYSIYVLKHEIQKIPGDILDDFKCSIEAYLKLCLFWNTLKGEKTHHVIMYVFFDIHLIKK